MPIDFSDYVDLSVHDLSPTDIYLGAIELARLVLPEFELRQGTPDDALFQAMAQMSALQVVAINRLPNRLMQGVAAIMGVTRDEGRKATVTANVISDYEGAYIPAGTIFIHQATVLGEKESYYYASTADLDIPAETTTTLPNGDPAAFPQGTVALSAIYVGIQPTINQNVDFTLDVVNPSVLSVYAANDFTNGSNAETASTYLNRVATNLSAASETVTTSSQMRSYILSNRTDVTKCQVYDNTDVDSPTSLVIGSDPSRGYVAIFVYGINRILTTEELYDITVDISQVSVAGLNIQATNFSLIDAGVTVDFVIETEYNVADMETLVQSTVAEFLSPSGFTSDSEAIQLSEIANVVRSITGIKYVSQVTLSDPDSLLALPDPPISVDAYGNYLFTKKGYLPNVSEGNVSANGRVV
jgi:hypothetical protein